MALAHLGAEADTALVEEVAITPANVNDGKAGADALPVDPGEVFTDSAYRGAALGAAVRAKGGTPRIVATGMWGHDDAETLARLDAWNRPIHRVRARIEKIFGTWKRSYGLRRMRCEARQGRPPGPSHSDRRQCQADAEHRLRQSMTPPSRGAAPGTWPIARSTHINHARPENRSKFSRLILPAHRSHNSS